MLELVALVATAVHLAAVAEAVAEERRLVVSVAEELAAK